MAGKNSDEMKRSDGNYSSAKKLVDLKGDKLNIDFRRRLKFLKWL
jgi:hypothetical protein